MVEPSLVLMIYILYMNMHQKCYEDGSMIMTWMSWRGLRPILSDCGRSCQKNLRMATSKDTICAFTLSFYVRSYQICQTPNSLEFLNKRHGAMDELIWRSAVLQMMISLSHQSLFPELLGSNLHFEAITLGLLKAMVESRELALDPPYLCCMSASTTPLRDIWRLH